MMPLKKLLFYCVGVECLCFVCSECQWAELCSVFSFLMLGVLYDRAPYGVCIFQEFHTPKIINITHFSEKEKNYRLHLTSEYLCFDNGFQLLICRLVLICIIFLLVCKVCYFLSDIAKLLYSIKHFMLGWFRALKLAYLSFLNTA